MLVPFIFLAAAALAPATETSGAAGSGDQKVVCKSERTVGSNMGSRVCKTKEKWAEDRQRGRDGMTDIQNRPGMKPNPGAGEGGCLIGGCPGGGPN